MKYDLILRCGIERAGTGFVDHFLFLNDKIAFFSGPGMRELDSYIMSHDGPFKPDVLKTVWGNEYQEGEHLTGGLSWVGAKEFHAYYEKRIVKRTGDIYAISHHLGEQWFSIYRDNFDCKIFVVYCARDIVHQYRSFKAWYQQETPEYFLNKLKASMEFLDQNIDDMNFMSITVPDYAAVKLKKRMTKLMKVIGVPFSKEQTLFMQKRRYLGKTIKKSTVSDKDLRKELEAHPEFAKINDAYDNLKSGAMDTA